jgi:hypothetical protein
MYVKCRKYEIEDKLYPTSVKKNQLQWHKNCLHNEGQVVNAYRNPIYCDNNTKHDTVWRKCGFQGTAGGTQSYHC